MQKFRTLLAATVLVLFSASVSAQSIDLGRGELPVTVPDDYDAATPAPLIVLLHGYTSSGSGQDSYMGFSAIADTYGFLLVSPDGDKESGGDENRFWNASSACCNFFQSDVDDSAYILSIIKEVKADFNVDANRVYLIGQQTADSCLTARPTITPKPSQLSRVLPALAMQTCALLRKTRLMCYKFMALVTALSPKMAQRLAAIPTLALKTQSLSGPTITAVRLKQPNANCAI